MEEEAVDYKKMAVDVDAPQLADDAFDWNVGKITNSVSPGDIVLSNLHDKVKSQIHNSSVSAFIIENFNTLTSDELKSISVAFAALASTGIPKQFSYINALDRTKVVSSIKTMPNNADLKASMNALVIMDVVQVHARHIRTRDGDIHMIGNIVKSGMEPRSGAFPVMNDELEKQMLIGYYEDRQMKFSYSPTIVSMTNPISSIEFEGIKKQLKSVNTFSLEKLRNLGHTAGHAKFATNVAKSVQDMLAKTNGAVQLGNIPTQLVVAISTAKTTLDACRRVRSTDNHEAETASYYFIQGATRNVNLLIWMRAFFKDNGYTLTKNIGNARWTDALSISGDRKLTIAIELSAPKGEIIKELDTLVLAGYLTYSSDKKTYSLSETSDDILVMVMLEDKPAFTTALANTLLSGNARVLPSPTPHNTHTFLSFSREGKRANTIDAGTSIYYFRWLSTMNVIRTVAGQVPSLSFVKDAANNVWNGSPRVAVKKNNDIIQGDKLIYPAAIEVLSGVVDGGAFNISQITFDSDTIYPEHREVERMDADADYSPQKIAENNKRPKIDGEEKDD